MNWLEIAVIAAAAVMALIGYKRGFVKMIVGILAMAIALIGTAFVAPELSAYINDNTQLRQTMSDKITSYLEEQVGDKLNQTTEKAQNEAVEKLKLPDNVKAAIIKNNKADTYIQMGVSSFAEYVSDYVSRTAISALSYIISFLVIYIALRIIFMLLNIVALLPFLNGVNKLAGAFLGLVQALVYVWVFFAVATAAVNTGWGMTVITLIGSSKFLTAIYKYNIILAAILKITA